MNAWPRTIIAFLSFIALLNGTVFYLAVNSQSARVESSPYEKGLVFEQNITARSNARAHGWSPNLSYSADTQALAFSIETKDAQLLPTSGLSLRLWRADDDSLDLDVDLSEVSAPPLTANYIPLKLRPGPWQYTISGKIMDIQVEWIGKFIAAAPPD